jgi:hypothetical protein
MSREAWMPVATMYRSRILDKKRYPIKTQPFPVVISKYI